MSIIDDYQRAGWQLCGIPRGRKGPVAKGWNQLGAKFIGDANVGLCHRWSGTCAADVDNYPVARERLLANGIELDALMAAINAVQIVSGKVNRAKLLYRLPDWLPSVSLFPYKKTDPETSKEKTYHALELRCATEGGLSVQDVLPPSIHPDTGKPYIWAYGDNMVGHWSNPPDIPEKLLGLWKAQLDREGGNKPAGVTVPPESRGMGFASVTQLLAKLDPENMAYDDWLKVGAIIHYETKGEGYSLWLSWSQRSSKHDVTHMPAKWRSFGGDHIKNPATIATLKWLVAEKLREDDRPIVRLEGGKLHEYAAQCEAILREEIYVRERTLARIGGAKEIAPDTSDQVRRDDSQAVIIPATTEYLRRRLNELVRFESYRRREKASVAVDCPKDLAGNIAGQGDWPNLRRLSAIARAPFVRADGSICESQGYDASSYVYYAPNASFPPVPDNPTRDNAERASDILLEPFREFPFDTEEGRSAFMANILTEAVRAALDTSPAFCFTAPIAGTGKTLLSEMPSRIVHGCGPSLRPWAEGSEEQRKSLFSSLLAGDRTIAYDNIPNGSKIRSPVLCAFLTADVYSDRKLGVSEMPALPNRSVVFLTGNNITPTGDLARRSIVIRLDANSERIRERKFRIADLRNHVATNRPTLLVAALTIIRAYIVAGRPGGTTPLPSFERWSQLVRDPLLWLGKADPVLTQIAETDDEAVPLAEAFRLIGANPTIRDKEFSASELANTCLFMGDQSLLTALEATGCSAPTDAKSIGYWLRDKRDRIAGGWKLERLRASGGVSSWRLRRIAP